jgi:acyl carrier protein
MSDTPATLSGEPARRFLNAYGPTETTVCATLAQDEDGSRKPTIGRPIVNMRVYVLDVHLQPTPIGVPGEICVGGVGVTRGYLKRPGLTAEKFIPDPFSGEQGGRLYRTGDKGRWLADGTVDYLGRLDEQVKIRGFRIELGEIESVLRAHPGVADVVVIAREDVPGDKRLAAYVVPADGAAEPGIAELRATAAERLPEYMVPSYFVTLAALPLTPNGKVDRRGLPAPDLEATRESAFVAAEGDLEEELATIWTSVLGAERVGVNDNFFEIGGHSLLLAQVQARLKEVLGREVPMVDLFRFPTIRALAAHLGEGVEDNTAERGQARAEARRAARGTRRGRR